MANSMTLNNGLTLGGMFFEKEKLIKELEEENKQLRAEKARFITENHTAQQEQSERISELNERLRLLTTEQTVHCNTIEILDTIKLEKNFLEEELQIQYETTQKQKDRISHLEDSLTEVAAESARLKSELLMERNALVEEKKETNTLNSLLGEKDVLIEQCRLELSKTKHDVETLRNALESKDRKLRNVCEERNRFQRHLLDLNSSKGHCPMKKRVFSSHIPVTPPRSPAPCDDHTSSPVTVMGALTPDNERGEGGDQQSLRPQDLEKFETRAFDMKEKHYLSLIFRLRTEISRLKGEAGHAEVKNIKSRTDKSVGRVLSTKSSLQNRTLNSRRK